MEMHNELAAKGMSQSGLMLSESARLDGERIKAMTEAKLDALLEGYELQEITIDDQMAVNLCDDVIQGMNQLVYACKCPTLGGSLLSGGDVQYRQMVAQAVHLSANLVKTQIDRRRFMAKKKNAPTTNYYVQGENARVNVNSTGHSVNVVMKSTEEFFGTIKQRIESGIPEGDERRKILESLTALQESHGKPTFAQRYTEFIATAADYVTLLTPFIPQLTQMLGRC